MQSTMSGREKSAEELIGQRLPTEKNPYNRIEAALDRVELGSTGSK